MHNLNFIKQKKKVYWVISSALGSAWSPRYISVSHFVCLFPICSVSLHFCLLTHVHVFSTFLCSSTHPQEHGSKHTTANRSVWRAMISLRADGLRAVCTICPNSLFLLWSPSILSRSHTHPVRLSNVVWFVWLRLVSGRLLCNFV